MSGVNGHINPWFLDLNNSGGEWLASPLYHFPPYPLDMRLGGPKRWYGWYGEVKILDPTELERWSIMRPACNQSLYQLCSHDSNSNVQSFIFVIFQIITSKEISFQIQWVKCTKIKEEYTVYIYIYIYIYISTISVKLCIKQTQEHFRFNSVMAHVPLC
jgi:hypothetical protein